MKNDTYAAMNRILILKRLGLLGLDELRSYEKSYGLDKHLKEMDLEVVDNLTADPNSDF